MSTLIELPNYECQKRVQALKIKLLIELPSGAAEIHFEDLIYCPHMVTRGWVEKHQPAVGDYLVWPDGSRFACCLPAVAFEAMFALASKQPSMTVAELHAHFRHPGFEYATIRAPLKAWAVADVPPEGGSLAGWEKNVDAGRNGWERFAFHEETYWRRRKIHIGGQAGQATGKPRPC